MPNPGIVAQGVVGIRTEAGFGSGGGVDNWQVIERISVDKTNRHVTQDRVRNTPEQVNATYADTAVGLQVTFPVSPQNPTQWWANGIGGTGPYTPSIPLNSMCIEVQEGSIGAVVASGDMIDSIELSSKKGDILRATVKMECKDSGPRVTPTSVPGTAFPSGDDPYLHTEATFTMDGVANQQVEAFSVTKQNNLIKDLYANNRTRRAIPATKALVTGSIQLYFENTTFRDRFLNHLPSSIVALYARGTKSYKIELNKIVYTSSSRPLDSQQSYILETLAYQAYVDDPSNENSLKLTVV